MKAVQTAAARRPRFSNLFLLLSTRVVTFFLFHSASIRLLARRMVDALVLNCLVSHAVCAIFPPSTAVLQEEKNRSSIDTHNVVFVGVPGAYSSSRLREAFDLR